MIGTAFGIAPPKYHPKLNLVAERNSGDNWILWSCRLIAATKGYTELGFSQICVWVVENNAASLVSKSCHKVHTLYPLSSVDGDIPLVLYQLAIGKVCVIWCCVLRMELLYFHGVQIYHACYFCHIVVGLWVLSGHLSKVDLDSSLSCKALFYSVGTPGCKLSLCRDHLR